MSQFAALDFTRGISQRNFEISRTLGKAVGLSSGKFERYGPLAPKMITEPSSR